MPVRQGTAPGRQPPHKPSIDLRVGEHARRAAAPPGRRPRRSAVAEASDPARRPGPPHRPGDLKQLVGLQVPPTQARSARRATASKWISDSRQPFAPAYAAGLPAVGVPTGCGRSPPARLWAPGRMRPPLTVTAPPRAVVHQQKVLRALSKKDWAMARPPDVVHRGDRGGMPGHPLLQVRMGRWSSGLIHKPRPAGPPPAPRPAWASAGAAPWRRACSSTSSVRAS